MKYRKLAGNEIMKKGDHYHRSDGVVTLIDHWAGSYVSSLVDGIPDAYVERPVRKLKKPGIAELVHKIGGDGDGSLLMIHPDGFCILKIRRSDYSRDKYFSTIKEMHKYLIQLPEKEN